MALKNKDKKFLEDVLKERRVQIYKNMQDVNGEIDSVSKDDLKDEGDLANADSSAVINSSILLQQKRELEEIQDALTKIKSGDYGTCEMCGEEIATLRLKAMPFARHCIICKEIVEKEQKERKRK
jgi:DnaK suppressor protein